MKIEINFDGEQPVVAAGRLKVPSRNGLPKDAKKEINAAIKQMKETANVSPLVFIINALRRDDMSERQMKILDKLSDFANEMRARLARGGTSGRQNMIRPGGRAIYPMPISIPFGAGYPYYYGHGPRGGRRPGRGHHGPGRPHHGGPRPGGSRPPTPPVGVGPGARNRGPQPAIRTSLSSEDNTPEK